MTDSHPSYRNLGKPFRRHGTTNHHLGEYARPGGIHSNTVEGVFSLLKRGMYGTFHSVSRKHLHRYLAEFDFRYNVRKIEDGERTALAIRNASGRRLTYSEQIGRIAS
jgi:transposase